MLGLFQAQLADVALALAVVGGRDLVCLLFLHVGKQLLDEQDDQRGDERRSQQDRGDEQPYVLFGLGGLVRRIVFAGIVGRYGGDGHFAGAEVDVGVIVGAAFRLEGGGEVGDRVGIAARVVFAVGVGVRTGVVGVVRSVLVAVEQREVVGDHLRAAAVDEGCRILVVGIHQLFGVGIAQLFRQHFHARIEHAGEGVFGQIAVADHVKGDKAVRGVGGLAVAAARPDFQAVVLALVAGGEEEADIDPIGDAAAVVGHRAAERLFGRLLADGARQVCARSGEVAHGQAVSVAVCVVISVIEAVFIRSVVDDVVVVVDQVALIVAAVVGEVGVVGVSAVVRGGRPQAVFLLPQHRVGAGAVLGIVGVEVDHVAAVIVAVRDAGGVVDRVCVLLLAEFFFSCIDEVDVRRRARAELDAHGHGAEGRGSQGRGGVRHIAVCLRRGVGDEQGLQAVSAEHGIPDLFRHGQRVRIAEHAVHPGGVVVVGSIFAVDKAGGL